MPKSIVARTTITILALSLLLGLIFAAGASIRAQKTEENRLQVQLQQLLSTVESTVSIACYLGDDTLAKEISQGLLNNQAVAGVRILGSGKALYESPQALQADGGIHTISRVIHSPFGNERIGEIILYTSPQEIRAQAQRYSYNTALVLGLQVAFVAAGVALVVFLLVTRPIRGISDELHRLEIDTGMRLQIPATNNSDEIGRLVADVNALISSLTSLLGTERQLRLEHEVQERKMKLIFDKAETAIFVLNDHGEVQSWNPAFARMLNITLQTGVRPWRVRLSDLLPPHALEIDTLLQNAAESGEACNMDVEVLPNTPKAAWFELSINPVAPGVLQGVINDVTERKRNELAAQRAASHDALTGLLNRTGVSRRLAELFSGERRNLKNTALLQIDLDYFKQVNDTYGHDAGDQVLLHVARALQTSVRRSDFVGRQGGDEFIAILTGVEGAAKAHEIANTIIAKISEPIDIGGGRSAHVSASIGIAFPENVNEPSEAVLRRADAAMYAAKQAGRSRAHLAASPAVSDNVAAVLSQVEK